MTKSSEKEGTKSFTVTVPASLHHRLSEAAHLNRESRAAIIRRVLSIEVDRLEREAQNAPTNDEKGA